MSIKCKAMETNEGQIIRISKLLPLDWDNLQGSAEPVRTVVYDIHVMEIDPTPIMDQIEIQIPTSMDKQIAQYFGICEYVVYFWPDKDFPEHGHRIIVYDKNKAYLYKVLNKKEAAQ